MTLSRRTIAFLGLLSLTTSVGAALTVVRRAPQRAECCYPGSPCCQPGAPCCQRQHHAG